VLLPYTVGCDTDYFTYLNIVQPSAVWRTVGNSRSIISSSSGSINSSSSSSSSSSSGSNYLRYRRICFYFCLFVCYCQMSAFLYMHLLYTKCQWKCVCQLLLKLFLLHQVESDIDEPWHCDMTAKGYKVTERILNYCINYANSVKGAHRTQPRGSGLSRWERNTVIKGHIWTFWLLSEGRHVPACEIGILRILGAIFARYPYPYTNNLYGWRWELNPGRINPSNLVSPHKSLIVVPTVIKFTTVLHIISE